MVAQQKLHILTAALLAAAGMCAVLAEEVEQAPAPQSCPKWTDGTVPVPVEHSEGACDWKAQNSPARYAAGWAALEHGLKTGALLRMKDEKTWICPDDNEGGDVADKGHPGAGFEMSGEDITNGPKRMWIVRNRSSNPISVALVDASRNNIEVSAVNTKTTPAHHDPEAVLSPGQWKAVEVTLGSIIHVRELLRVGDELAPGRVLLRYRPGPIAIKDRSFEPVDAPVYEDVPDVPDPPAVITKKESQRGKFDFDRRCNSLNLLFVNRVGKPVDVYWAGASDIDSSAGAAERANHCEGRFAFHMGVDRTVKEDEDFFVRRDTFMSLENTYNGHMFVARLTSDPSRVVDEIFLDRTNVMDCPKERKAKDSATARHSVGVEVGGKVEEGHAEEAAKIVLQGYDNAASNVTAAYLGAVGSSTP